MRTLQVTLSVTSAWVKVLLMLLCMSLQGFAVTISRTSDSVLYVDLGNGLQCSYVSYSITNNDGVNYSNLWVSIDSFSSPTVRLGGSDPGQYPLDALPAGATKSAFFYLQATNTTAVAQTHTIKIWRGLPVTGTLLASSNFSLTVSSSGANNSSKVNAVIYAPNPPTVGGIVTLNIYGDAGQTKAGDTLDFTPAAFTNWNATAFRMTSVIVGLTNGGTTTILTNYLKVPTSLVLQSSSLPYFAQFQFRALSVTTSSIPVSPITYANQGSGISHSDTGQTTYGSLLPIQSPSNTTVMAKFANVTQIYTNQPVTYTVSVTNTGPNDMQLDQIVDTLPAGYTYVTGSSLFNGSAILNPAISGQQLTWSEDYVVPANTNRSLVFQATPTGANVITTNSVIGFAGLQQVDTTLNASDNVPATAVVRVLWSPSATNDVGSLLEDSALSVVAPGVLANDFEPNGFSISVFSYTQPAGGSVTMSTNGAYTYTPAANFYGADSFTYTLTNGNGRTASATVNITVTAVNDPPTLNALGNLVINEDAPLQTVNLSGITVGPTNEVGQALTVTATSSNPGLIPNPSVNYTSPSSTGSLQFTPVSNSNGVATITVIVTDNGGTANGGVNAVTNTFTVTVTAVNDPPTLAALGNLTINEDAPEQTVNLTGITAGPADEAGQTLTVTSSSSNPSLIPNPTVTYTSPAATGSLKFTPVANANGVATITVIVTDNGGTANGGVNAVTNTFTVTVTAVNDAPTLNAFTNLFINEAAGLQTVNLSGITAGPTNESSQTLAVAASSSNTGVIPNPLVSYVSPSASGSLSFTSVSGALGTSTISVVVTDNGGTANGGVDATTNTFTVTVVALTNTWAAGGNLALNVTNASGSPGAGYSSLNLTGYLDVQATTGNPITLNVTSYDGSSPGNAAGFNYNSNYTWTVASTTRGVLGFSADKFVLNTSSFANDLAGGTFSVALSGDGLSVIVVFTPNHAPVASPVPMGRAWGTFLRIPIATIISDYTSDVDGDGRAFVQLGASTNGSFLSTNSTYILFAPTNNIPESFAYVVRDLRAYRPGDSIQLATNYITVSVTNAVSSAQSITSGGGGITVTFAGVPGYAYDVERSPDMFSWTVVLTTNAPASGIWQYYDAAPPNPSAYYRTRQH